MPEVKEIHRDSLLAIKELNNHILQLHKLAYLAATIDTVGYGKDSILEAYINCGSKYRWVRLSKGNVGENLLDKTGFKEKFYIDEDFSYKDIQKLERQIIDYSENHGYPFASIKLDSIILNDSLIQAALVYAPGPYIVFDSVTIVGKTHVKKKFLINYLRIFPGQPYSQEKVMAMQKLIQQQPYLKQTQPAEVLFVRKKAKITLHLEETKSNQADGIIGFLPNANNNNKLLLTGQLNLNLRNLFSSGKNLQAAWQTYNQGSQTLGITYLHPKLLGSNIDARADFNLLKQDSAFLNVSRRLTLLHNVSKAGKVNFFAELKTSRILSGSDSSGQSIQPGQPALLTTALNTPPFADFNCTSYGGGYSWNKLDNLLYPMKGWTFNSIFALGDKKIIQDGNYNEKYYPDVQVRSTQYSFTLQAEQFLKVGRRAVFYTRLSGGDVTNKNNLFYSDLYRLGGIKSIRGFNENFFYASSYVLGNFEYRLFTDPTSYLFLFVDQGWLRNVLSTATPYDTPTGFGMGVSFTTGAGIFNFAYGLGTSKVQPLNINQSKIHFGIVSRF